MDGTEDRSQTNQLYSTRPSNLPNENALTDGISNIAQKNNQQEKESPLLRVEEDSICINATIDPDDDTEHSPPKKRWSRPSICKHDGCINQVLNGGVCHRHGAELRHLKCNTCRMHELFSQPGK